MKVRDRYEPDEWSQEGLKITSPENLESVRSVLENEGPILVKHWFYRAATGPQHMVFDDYEDFVSYLNEHAYAGDAFDVWSILRICEGEKCIAQGKCPDEDGLIPRRGAY